MKSLKTPAKYGLVFAVLMVAGLALIVGLNPDISHAQNARQQDPPRTAVKMPPPAEAEPFAEDILAVAKADGERLYFNIELALTPAQHAQGLMHRTAMPEDSGMLFIFQSPRKASFWMKDTLIPLDMIFVHPDGTIHHIHHNARPQDETSITAQFPAKAVLELNGGTADKLGIKEGDQLIHRLFRNDAAKQ